MDRKAGTNGIFFAADAVHVSVVQLRGLHTGAVLQRFWVVDVRFVVDDLLLSRVLWRNFVHGVAEFVDHVLSCERVTVVDEHLSVEYVDVLTDSEITGSVEFLGLFLVFLEHGHLVLFWHTLFPYELWEWVSSRIRGQNLKDL